MGGRGPCSRVTAVLKRYAPSRIVYIILHRLSKAVSQKVVLSWLVLDILVTIGLLVFYLLFKDLAALGFFKVRGLWLLCVPRLLFLLFGVSVVWNRRHSYGEAFFLTFLVNMVLFVAFLVPIERLVCDCRTGTWAQCNAAQSFTFPEGERYNPYRPMPIDEDVQREELGPDTRMQKAEPPDILYVLRPPKSSSLLQEMAIQEPSLRLPKRLLGKKALHQGPQLGRSMLMLDALDPSKDESKETETSETSKQADEPQEPEEPKDKAKESEEADKTKESKEPKEADETKEPKEGKEADESKDSKDSKEESSSEVSKACREALPKGVPETLTEEDIEALNNLTVLTELRRPLPAKIKKDLDEGEQQKILDFLHELCDEHTGTLSKMPKKTAESKEESSESSDRQVLYQTDLVELKGNEQLKALDQHFRRSCRCQGHSSCNWYSYGAHMTMWCYVEESSVPWCHLEGIQLFKDTKNKTWTVDLCHEGSCKCAGLGMPAEDEDEMDPDNPLIQKNPIYYGYKCGKWRNGDTLSWCWAGMDTSCFNRDRPLPPDYKTSSWPKGMLYMFRSVEPCSNNNLGQGPGGRLQPALQLCEYLQVTLEILMYLHLIWMFPMGGIIFKFICNRCGDAIQTEHQFQAYDTSEDSDEPQTSRPETEQRTAATAGAARDSFTAWEAAER